ncbi:MAG: hypothetical protein JO287_01750, partial [Pseudonocardiales bacterium]|nr:hypothetical protein [Pseudonocardiales bacterium]
MVPAQALERVLFLEADRMAAPRLTEDMLRTQTAVVKEEIRQSVLGRAYGVPMDGAASYWPRLAGSTLAQRSRSVMVKVPRVWLGRDGRKPVLR